MVVPRKWTFWRNSDRALGQAADEVVRRCRRDVTDRLRGSELADRMGAAELRGYVRARGAELVDETIGELLSCRGLPETLRPDLTTRATDILVPHVVHDVLWRPFVGARKQRVA
jgi:hypothetical protein